MEPKGAGGGGGTPYIQMIGMIVVFLGVVIVDLVIFRGCSSKILRKIKLVFVRM